MKIYIAAAWNDERVIKKYMPPYVLESFMYVQDWLLPLVPKFKGFLFDSGAFTFMRGRRETDLDWEEYLGRYIDFIQTNQIQDFFELDIDVVVGYDRVKKMTRTIERKTGRQPIPVWHKSRGLDTFKGMCKDYPYVAIGGIVSREIPPRHYEYLIPLVELAHEQGARIHGLGFTSQKWLRRVHFDSVDSGGWVMAAINGSLVQYQNGRMTTIRRPPGKVLKYGRSERLDWNMREWMKYINRADQGVLT